MIIKVGSIVSHAGAPEWGVGKVLEVTASLAMIQFSDGKSRKIAVSHFTTLESAAAAAFVPLHDSPVATKPARPIRVPKKTKTAAAAGS